MKEKLTWRHLLARSFSRTPETLQKVLKGIVKKETNKDKRVQLYNTVRWSSDNLHTVSGDQLGKHIQKLQITQNSL